MRLSLEVFISNSHFPYVFNGLQQSVGHRNHLTTKKKAKVVLLTDQKPHRELKEATKRKNAVD